MAALMKRQGASVAGVAVASKTGGLTPAQILAQAGLQAQGPGQVAALVKTAGGQHLPLTIPQVKATLAPGVKAAAATPQQIRQLTLQNQLLAQQRSKLTGQKVAQLGQVMVTNKGVPAQLIVQSQKSVPTTMTMQQIQQVIKHVHPQHIAHVSASGQTVASQGASGQVISHAVLAKPGTSQTRVIPQQSIKQTIQVVTASPGVRTSVPNVTIDSAGRPTVSMASAAIKVTSAAQQQALLNQVTAAFQQGQQIAVRQTPVRIQASGSSTPLVAVAVTQAPTLLTLSHPQPDNAGVHFLNRLPNSIKDAATPKALKTRLKRLLVSQAFYNAGEFLAFDWETAQSED
ncbi:hypothetical protein J6590_102193 [Homalodisca vitripennis]|nr:hypothetical protein J6590_102193 [Homalodisca vitripennis]